MPRLNQLVKILAAFSLIGAVTETHAQQCNININHGVIIDPAHIRILDEGNTFIQINGENQLFYRGREMTLTPAQQATLSNFATNIRQQFPELVSMAIEGVEVGLKAVNKVIAGVTGENSDSHQKLQKKLDQLKWQIRKRLNQSNENFYIAPQDFDDFEEIFAGQFEKEIESIVTESIGTILVAVGEAITNREENNNEQHALSFEERMAAMGDELELEMSSKVSALKSKAAMFCAKLKQLDIIEQQLVEQIPALSQFDLISDNN